MNDPKETPVAKAETKGTKVEGRSVEVLKNGFKSRYGTAARGAKINMSVADAELFAKSGDVRILGAI